MERSDFKARMVFGRLAVLHSSYAAGWCFLAYRSDCTEDRLAVEGAELDKSFVDSFVRRIPVDWVADWLDHRRLAVAGRVSSTE